MDRHDKCMAFPTGDGRLTISLRWLHCVVPDGKDQFELVHECLKGILTRLRHVSRQATLPTASNLASVHFSDVNELPAPEFGEPYFGNVWHGDSPFCRPR
jgi:hypothetical protein